MTLPKTIRQHIKNGSLLTIRTVDITPTHPRKEYFKNFIGFEAVLLTPDGENRHNAIEPTIERTLMKLELDLHPTMP